MTRHVAALVPAAGLGERLGHVLPKALVPVAGVPVVTRAVDGLRASGGVDTVIVAAPVGAIDLVRAALGAEAAADEGRPDVGRPGVGRPDVIVVEGGVDRIETVALALDHLPPDTDVVLVHDAARCLCPSAVVHAVVEAVRAGHAAVVPAVAVADTLKRVSPDHRVSATVDRRGLVGVQTPQGFAPVTLRDAHARAAADRAAGRDVPATDDAGLVEAAGAPVATVPGDPRAFKITTPLDLAMAEALVVAGPA